ncbi:MAG: hypothetical protein GY801_44225 [bacterium]|nr:hypothetical protein [bacterium]
MKTYADLEIGLHRRDAERYQIDLRFSRPDSETDDRLTRKEPACIRFDFEALRRLVQDAEAYGTCLSESLFTSQELRAAFDKAQSIAQTCPRLYECVCLSGRALRNFTTYIGRLCEIRTIILHC